MLPMFLMLLGQTLQVRPLVGLLILIRGMLPEIPNNSIIMIEMFIIVCFIVVTLPVALALHPRLILNSMVKDLADTIRKIELLHRSHPYRRYESQENLQKVANTFIKSQFNSIISKPFINISILNLDMQSEDMDISPLDEGTGIETMTTTSQPMTYRQSQQQPQHHLNAINLPGPSTSTYGNRNLERERERERERDRERDRDRDSYSSSKLKKIHIRSLCFYYVLVKLLSAHELFLIVFSKNFLYFVASVLLSPSIQGFRLHV